MGFLPDSSRRIPSSVTIAPTAAATAVATAAAPPAAATTLGARARLADREGSAGNFLPFNPEIAAFASASC
jgi:hypothetical protein